MAPLRVAIIGSPDDLLTRSVERALVDASVPTSILGLDDWAAGLEITGEAVRFRGAEMPSVLLRNDLSGLAGPGFSGAETCAVAWSGLALSESTVINRPDPAGPQARRDVNQEMSYASQLDDVRSDLAVRDLATGSSFFLDGSHGQLGPGSYKLRTTLSRTASYQVVTVLGQHTWLRDEGGGNDAVVRSSIGLASDLGVQFATFTWECGPFPPLLVRFNEFPRAWEIGRHNLESLLDRLCAELAPSRPHRHDCDDQPEPVPAGSGAARAFFPASNVIDVLGWLAESNGMSLDDAAEVEHRRRLLSTEGFQ